MPVAVHRDDSEFWWFNNYADGPYPIRHMLGDGMLISCGDGGMQVDSPLALVSPSLGRWTNGTPMVPRQVD